MRTSWNVDIELYEDGDHTRADAVADIAGRR